MEKDLRNKNTGRDSKRQSADVEEKSPDNRYTKKRPLWKISRGFASVLSFF